MRVTRRQLRTLIREQLGVNFLLTEATSLLRGDPYFGGLVEAARVSTAEVFGAPVADHNLAELQVAHLLSEAHTGGALVFTYGSHSTKVPVGFAPVPCVRGLFIPAARKRELRKLTREGARDLKALVTHHKPDVVIWDDGAITEVEVKHTRRKTFNQLPKACRTDYDYYVLISENDTFFIHGDTYRRIAQHRTKGKGPDIGFTQMKKKMNADALHTQVRGMISELGSENLSNALVDAVMHRLTPSGKQGQMTMPFRIDGHKVRLDLKLESSDRG